MPDYASLDLILAILHHLLIFALFGVLAAEFVLIRPGLGSAEIRRLGAIDLSYGAMAGLILIVGFARAVYAAKGWDYYAHNHFFWAKIGTFAFLSILSIMPTLRIMAWRRAQKLNPAALPGAGEIAGVRRYLWAELGLFALLPIFAAAMARGYGSM